MNEFEHSACCKTILPAIKLLLFCFTSREIKDEVRLTGSSYRENYSELNLRIFLCLQGYNNYSLLENNFSDLLKIRIST